MYPFLATWNPPEQCGSDSGNLLEEEELGIGFDGGGGGGVAGGDVVVGGGDCRDLQIAETVYVCAGSDRGMPPPLRQRAAGYPVMGLCPPSQ